VWPPILTEQQPFAGIAGEAARILKIYVTLWFFVSPEVTVGVLTG